MPESTSSREARKRFSPNRMKRRDIVLLRGVLIVAVGGLLIVAEGRPGLSAPLVLLVGYVLTNVLLMLAPLRFVSSKRLELTMGAADLVLVALGIQLAGAGRVLPISCLLMVLVVALGHYRAHTVAGALAVGALHSWLVLGENAEAMAVSKLALQVLFLCSVALYYGYLVDNIYSWRRRVSGERLDDREQKALLRILNVITSSLDLRHVATTIVNEIGELLPVVRCSLLFITEDRKNCFVMASHDEPSVDMLEIDLKRYPEVLKAVETRQPVLIRDIASDPLMARVRAVLEELDVHSIAVIPLTFGEQVLGTLCLRTARGGQMFTRREINFCIAVAGASANALKNALLHRQVADESRSRRETGEKLTSILDHSPDLILTTDNEGRITEFNRGAETLLGHSRTALLEKPCATLFTGDKSEGIVERIQQAGVLYNESVRLKRKEGSEVELQVNMSVLRDDEDKPAGTVWLGRDVTELKQAQIQLVQAEKLSSIGEAISGVAHELNNPLSGVLGYSQLLMMRHPNSPMIRELERINESAIRCQKIVKNLLSFSRATPPERKYLGVNGILKKTLDLRVYQLQVSNIEVVCDLDSDLPQTMLDFHQMQQVFLNLINNAQQAMTPGRERPGRLTLRTSCTNGWICVEVVDNGQGMSQQTLERIFDPFFTTKEQGQGTGLGLSVSYGIVKEHGGRIFAHSRQGEGTTFVIELPVVRNEERAETAATGNRAGMTVPTGEGGRILVVDDEAVIVSLLFDILGGAGYQVDSASNGNEAKRKLASGEYDLVISDIRMPQMNGMELYREIRESRPDLCERVIFSTGDMFDKHTAEFLEESGARMIAKPFEVDEVLRVVAEFLPRAVACRT